MLLLGLTLFEGNAQDFIIPREISPCEEMSSYLEDSIITVLVIDFSGDGEDDFICTTVSDFVKTDWWLTSEMKIVKEQCHYDAYYKFWFIQLDEDPELETYNAWGYPEGIDYYFVDYNFTDKQEKILCYINPVILDSTESKVTFWGYPWDITGIFMNGAEILCSTKHEVQRDGVDMDHPAWQKTLPIVFFRGKSTQPEVQVERFDEPRYMTMKQLITRIKR